MLQTFAEDLKYFREKKNLTLKDVALDTRLNMSVLESIETGDFTFQPQTYIRAFLRQYAKSIGMNPDEILKDYELAKTGKYSTKRLPEEKKPEAFEDIKKEQPKVEVKKTVPPVIEKSKEEIKKPEEAQKEETQEEVQKESKEEVFDNFNIDEFRRNDEEPKETDKEIVEDKKEDIIIEETKPESVSEVKKERQEEPKQEVKPLKKKEKSEEFNFPPPRNEEAHRNTKRNRR